METSVKVCPNCFYAPYAGGRCPQCGYTATESVANAITLHPGTSLKGGRYILGRVLGIGGFGMTYLALDTANGNIQAVKEYFPASLAVRESNGTMAYNGTGDARVFDHGLRAFIREAQSLHKFVGDPYIVQVYQAFSENGTAYFAMEYLNGLNLMMLCKNMGGKLPLSFALDICLSVAAALSRVHAEGLLHRDVSPGNIFVTKEGAVKLIDFGATRYFVGDVSRSLAVVLKPGFAPPEQYSSKGNQGPWTDVYALAATLYYSVTGSKVPEAPDRLAGKPMVPISNLIPGIDRKLSNVLEKALALNFRDRYQSMAEFESAVLSAQQGTESHIQAEKAVVSVQTPTPAQAQAYPPQYQVPSPMPANPSPYQAPLPVPMNPQPYQSPLPMPAAPLQYQSPPPAQAYSAPYPAQVPAPAQQNQKRGLFRRPIKDAVQQIDVAGTPYISIETGAMAGEKWAIPFNMDIKIGRVPGVNNIVITDIAVSREHCVVRFDQKNGVFFLRDISTNGTFSENGMRYEKGKNSVLVAGERFSLVQGNWLFRLGLE